MAVNTAKYGNFIIQWLAYLSSNIQNTHVGMEVLEYGNVTLTGGEILSKLSALRPEWMKDDNTSPSNEDLLLDWSPGNELPRKPDILRKRKELA